MTDDLVGDPECSVVDLAALGGAGGLIMLSTIHTYGASLGTLAGALWTRGYRPTARRPSLLPGVPRTTSKFAWSIEKYLYQAAWHI